MTYSQNSPSPAFSRKKVRVTDFKDWKSKKKVTCITCYDASFARLVEMSEIDLVLVGDSLGHVMQGHHTTLGVTLEEMIYHTRCVSQTLKSPFLVADVPFGYAGLTTQDTLKAAVELMRAGAHAVKIEGASAKICESIQTLVEAGIPVMGHIGLTPQSVHGLGGYKIQGKGMDGETRLLSEASKLQESGCFSIVLELVVSDTAKKVTESLMIPTIGIGSGKDCDGQILVLQDMLGMNQDFAPKFLKHFADLQSRVVGALNDYAHEVQNSQFPS